MSDARPAARWRWGGRWQYPQRMFRSRILMFGLALAVFGAQFMLQVHLVKHDLLPRVHQVCEQCVTAKSSAPPPAVATVLVLASHAVAPDEIDSRAPLSRTPLVERSRGPPAPLS